MSEVAIQMSLADNNYTGGVPWIYSVFLPAHVRTAPIAEEKSSLCE
jgi:hypothetical protein